MAISPGFRILKGIATPVCALVRNDTVFPEPQINIVHYILLFQKRKAYHEKFTPGVVICSFLQYYIIEKICAKE